jgi:molybdopterin-guanine dinucleotide biosynthesis protein A
MVCSEDTLTTKVSGIILAGGASSRLGQDKALVQIAGRTLIERVIDVLRDLVREIVLVTPAPGGLAWLGLPTATDLYPGVGTLGGLHAGLTAIASPYGLVVGCDMPFLQRDLLAYMIAQIEDQDVIMPKIGRYYEPLHALYARRTAASLEQSILAGQRRIRQALAGLRIRYILEGEIEAFDPEHLSFFNVNTPKDLERAHEVLDGQDPERDRA